MRINKTVKITFRVSSTLSEYIDSVSRNLKIERSELLRTVIMYFFMSARLGKLEISYKNIMEEFLANVAKSEEGAEQETTK